MRIPDDLLIFGSWVLRAITIASTFANGSVYYLILMRKKKNLIAGDLTAPDEALIAKNHPLPSSGIMGCSIQ